MATASTNTKLKVQRTIFDLESMSELTVQKEFDHTPITSVADALHRLGNDNGKLVAILEEGMQAEARRKAGAEAGGWVVEDEDGNVTPFGGTQADSKKVNALVLTLAKTVFGYSKDLDGAGKASAKQSAMDMVKNTKAIRDGLVKSAAITE